MGSFAGYSIANLNSVFVRIRFGLTWSFSAFFGLSSGFAEIFLDVLLIIIALDRGRRHRNLPLSCVKLNSPLTFHLTVYTQLCTSEAFVVRFNQTINLMT